MIPIVVTDDELKRLEKRFGPSVRQMGQWISDGTFGYSSVPVAALEKASEALKDPHLSAALSQMERTPDLSRLFIDLIETYGPALIDKIVGAYREGARLQRSATPSKPPRPETMGSWVATAAG